MTGADDRELERYLRHDDALSRAYAELKSERPSPALDQAVLARARDALKNAPRGAPARRRNWTAITAIAATVLLSFGLVMRLALEPEAQLSEPTAQDAMAPRPAATPPAEADKALSGAAPRPEESPRFNMSPPSSAPASSIEGKRPAIEAEIRSATEQAPEHSDSAAPAAVLESQSAPPVPAVAPPPKLGEVQQEAPPASERLRRDREYSDEAAAAGPTSGLLKSQSQEATTRDLATAGRTEYVTAPAKEEFTLTPEAWLAEIQRLREAGETEAAARELERFNLAYPDYLESHRSQDPAPERQ